MDDTQLGGAQLGMDSPDQEATRHDGIGLTIDALREQGAQRLDPVRLHYLTALARRMADQPANVRGLLEAKFAAAATTLQARLEHARGEATAAIAVAAKAQPRAAPALNSMLAAGDFQGLGRQLQALQQAKSQETLGDLVRSLAQHPPADDDALLNVNLESRSDLKAVQQSRNTWSKLSADKQVTRALQQSPKNAGPINSHMLVLRSVALMREISPDYLSRFMTYVDTLLVREQGEKARQADALARSATPARGKTKARRTPGR